MKRLLSSFRATLLTSCCLDLCRDDYVWMVASAPLLTLPDCETGEELYGFVRSLNQIGIREIVDAGLTQDGYAIVFDSNHDLDIVRAYFQQSRPEIKASLFYG